MQDLIAEDARFAAAAKLRQARGMTPGMKFRAGADLFEEACCWSLAGLRSRFPGKTEEERVRILRNHLSRQTGR
jgi:hypothetical protein